MTTTIYTCSSASTTESDLILAGATQLSITYQYELVTKSSSEDDDDAAVVVVVDEAIERVQSAMLHRVAVQSGLIDCSGKIIQQQNDPWRQRRRRRRRLNTHGSSDGEVAERMRVVPARRRALRAGGRGSNSIVGLSSNPPDEPSSIPCRGDVTTNNNVATIPQVLDPFEDTEREVTPGLAGSVIMGDDLDSSSDVMIMAGAFDGSEIIDTVKFSTRIDGVNVQRGANSNPNHQQLQQLQQQQQQQPQQQHDNNNNNHNRDLQKKNEETREGDDSNDTLDMLAFNYISTQSIPIERSSRTSHNPLSPPTVFQQSSKIISNAVRPKDGPIIMLEETMPNSNNDDAPLEKTSSISSSSSSSSSTTSSSSGSNTLPIILQQQQQQQQQRPHSSSIDTTKKCTVIQGRMSVYTSASEAQAKYENLQGRIFAALAEDVNNNNNDYVDDDDDDDGVVLGVLMRTYDDDGDRRNGVVAGGGGDGVDEREDPISESTGYASAINGGGLGGNTNNNNNTLREENSNSISTAPMAVLVTLVCVLIALVALFVRTSKPKQRQQQKQRQRQQPTKSFKKKKKMVSSDGSEPSLAGTYYDDEVEMDAKDLNTPISSDDDDDDDDGDYSVDRFSISSAKDESVYPLRLLRSFGSRGKKTAAAAVASFATKDGNAASAATSSSAAAAAARIEGRGSARAASKGAAAEDDDDDDDDDDDTDVPYIQSSSLGLFAAQPRAETPENEVELDYSSVYDCDDGVESVITPNFGRVATATDRSTDRHALPPVTEDGDDDDDDEDDQQPAVVKPSKSFLGSLLRGRAKSRDENYGKLDDDASETDAPSLEEGGKRPVYRDGDDDGETSYVGPVDVEASSMSARLAYATANRNALRSNANKAATPGNIARNVGLGGTDQSGSPRGHGDNETAKPLSSTLLQFFTARNQCTAPHTEVEAGLRPFDECSEYSASVAGRQYGQEVDPDYLFGHQCGTESDRIVLSEEAKQTKARMVRKFSKMIQRVKAPVVACDGGDDAREIHQIYSQDVKDDATPRKESRKASARSTPRKESRNASGRSTDVYMMQKMPSTLRPIESYDSPNGLSVRTRSQLSQARSNTVRDGESDEGGDRTPCIVIADEDSVAICDARMMCDSLVPECLR